MNKHSAIIDGHEDGESDLEGASPQQESSREETLLNIN